MDAQRKPLLGKDRRAIERVAVRVGEAYSLRFPDGSTARIYDFSPLGVAALVSAEQFALLSPDQPLRVGLDLPRDGGYHLELKLIWSLPAAEGGHRVGLRVVPVKPAAVISLADHRFIHLPADRTIGIVMAKGHTFSELTTASILALSPSQALLIFADARQILFPDMVGEFGVWGFDEERGRVQYQVLRVEEAPQAQLLVTVRLLELKKPLRRFLADYLFQHSGVSLSTLRAAGFIPRQVSDKLKFRFVTTHQQYEAVLRLRLRAYREAGKCDHEDPWQLASELDYSSRLLAAYHGTEVVGSVALTFPRSEDVVLDCERALPGGRFPEGLPPRTEMMEVARLCTHPDYRKGDLLLYLFKHIYATLYQSERNYIVTSTDDKLWRIYRRLGFRKQGLTYDHPVFVGVPHDVILVHQDSAAFGRGSTWLFWHHIFGDINRFLRAEGYLDWPLMARLRAGVSQVLAAALKLWRRLKGRR